MKVYIDNFWIEGVLIDQYPNFHKNKGADIDENGSSISTRPGRIDRIFKFENPDNDSKLRIATRLLKRQENIDLVMQKGYSDSGAQFSERCIQLALKEYWNE